LQKEQSKLVKFGTYLEEVNGEAREGIGAIEGGQYQYLFICSKESRAIKKRDVWTVKALREKEVISENRFSKNEAVVPIEATCCGMRRITGVNTIDVTKDLDFIVLRDFPDLPKFLELFKGKERGLSFMSMWERHVTGMLGNLAFMRRFNISAQGSKLMAFYSSSLMAPLGLMWSIKAPLEDAKFLSLWLNSTPNMLQVLRDRKETEGAFMQIDEYTLNDLMILNPMALSHEEKQHLSKLFEKIRNQEFPSILHQLKNRFPPRTELDFAVLRVLGFGDVEINRILDYLYPALANEIQQLKTLMQG